ncbi:hypothetical protein QBC34DRAFT_381340 [Podospora aff. communis PSN243]|uniref:Uncharacterized protein n=1 Tax=Podospora aff. communis PSN243 TaxID=3040156 RepID=A0AAV9GLW7_9PEZI|nr:hypothetical protein QBC34DRAFT_381340 [Podospora aff. communis PSN243]
MERSHLRFLPDPAPTEDFSWLDAIDADGSYAPLDLSNARHCKPLDCGIDGFNASLSTSHDLLQLGCPDPDHGEVCVKSSDQRTGFGLRVHIKDSTLEPTPAQGFVNLRWPCARFKCVGKSKAFGPDNSAPWTQTVCTFTRRGTLYQIVRIVPSNILLMPETRPTVPDDRDGGRGFTIELGGCVRFGSYPATDGDGTSGPPRITSPHFEDEEGSYAPAVESAAYKKRLVVRLWRNREPLKLSLLPCRSKHHKPDDDQERKSAGQPWYFHMSVKPPVSLPDDQPTVIVASWTLQNIESPYLSSPTECISDVDAMKWVGIRPNSVPGITSPQQLEDRFGMALRSYQIWKRALATLCGTDENLETTAKTIGRTVETVLRILPLPARWPDDLSVRMVSKSVVSADLESTFWHVRALVKAQQLILRFIEDKQTVFASTEQARRYRETILDALWLVFLGILNESVENQTLKQDSSLSSRSLAASIRDQSSPDQRLYLPIIVWYILHHLPDRFRGEAAVKSLGQILHLPSVEDDNASHGLLNNENPHGCLLRWYHCQSVLQICARLRELSGPDGMSPADLTDLEDLEELSSYWEHKAKRSLYLYTQGRLRNTALGHRAANLALVQAELNIKDIPNQDDDKTCLDLARRVVRHRMGLGEKDLGSMLHTLPSESSCCLDRHLPVSLGLASSELERQKWLSECGKYPAWDFLYTSSPGGSTPAGRSTRWGDLLTSSVVCSEMMDHVLSKAGPVE